MIRGGNWDNGANAGVFAFNANNGPSNVNNNVGFRCGRGDLRADSGPSRRSGPSRPSLRQACSFHPVRPGEKNEVPRGGLVVRLMRANGRTGQI